MWRWTWPATGCSKIDRRQDRVTRELRVGGSADGVAAAVGRLWVIGQEHATRTSLDARSLRLLAVLRFGPSELWPAVIVAGPRGVWLITGWRGEVSLIDPKTFEVVARVQTPHVDALAATAGSIWPVAPAKTERRSCASPLEPRRPRYRVARRRARHSALRWRIPDVAIPGALLELDL